MDWHRGESIILDGAWGTLEENEASSVPESKILIPV